MSVNGFTNTFDIEASGASMLKDYGFEARSLNADLSGASSMYIFVENEIDIEASGASTLHFMGPATIVHQDLSGSSSVKNMN